MLGLAPRLPITITLLTAMTTNLLVRLRPLPVHRAGRVCFAFITAKIFRAALSQKLEGRAQISGTRERSGRQAVPEQRGPKGWRGVLVWCPLRMLLLAHSKRGTEHFFPSPLPQPAARRNTLARRRP